MERQLLLTLTPVIAVPPAVRPPIRPQAINKKQASGGTLFYSTTTATTTSFSYNYCDAGYHYYYDYGYDCTCDCEWDDDDDGQYY